jgi:hypothetical protein
LGPRRPLALLTVLAFAALFATAGVAFAAGNDDRGPGAGDARSELDHAGHGRDVAAPADGAVQGEDTGKDHVGKDATGKDATGKDATGKDDTGKNNTGGNNDGPTVADVGSVGSGGVDASGANHGSDDVTGTSVGDLSTPVEAPAAAPSGPAPDGAAAAPAISPVVDAFVVDSVAAVAPGGEGSAPPNAPATEPAIPVAAPDMSGLAGLPELGSVGAVANHVSSGPSAARELLSTGPGRSLAVVAVLLLAIGVFLSVHRWTDRGDRKLAAARRGSDVARFR